MHVLCFLFLLHALNKLILTYHNLINFVCGDKQVLDVPQKSCTTRSKANRCALAPGTTHNPRRRGWCAVHGMLCLPYICDGLLRRCCSRAPPVLLFSSSSFFFFFSCVVRVRRVPAKPVSPWARARYILLACLLRPCSTRPQPRPRSPATMA